MRISLRQLEVFDAICRLGSVTAAAAEVGLSQSAASQSLAELESALDGALFDRAGRRLLLNARGEALRGRAVELLERAQAAEQALRGDQAVHRRLVIAASRTIGASVLPSLLGRYLRDQPGLRLQLWVRNSAEVVEELRSFRADLGFVEGGAITPELRALPWRGDRLVLVAAGQAQPPAQLTPQDLAAARWVLREPGSGTRAVVDRAFAGIGVQPQIALEVDQPEAQMAAVAAGAGWGILSEHLAAEALRRGELRLLHAPSLELRRVFHAVVHASRYLSPALRALAQALEIRLDAGDATASLARAVDPLDRPG